MIDLEAIKNRLAAVNAAGVSVIHTRLVDHNIRVLVSMRDWSGNNRYDADEAVTTLLGHAPTDITALLAEVERLRGEVDRERAAVVAWLRVAWGAVNLVSTDIVSAEIERGEHRREEKE